MSLHPKVEKELLERGYSRRNIGRIALGAAAALPFFHEFSLAQEVAAARRFSGGGRTAMDPDVIRISGNENPMGPCPEAAEAIHNVVQKGGRYMYQPDR